MNAVCQPRAEPHFAASARIRFVTLAEVARVLIGDKATLVHVPSRCASPVSVPSAHYLCHSFEVARWMPQVETRVTPEATLAPFQASYERRAVYVA